MNVSPDMMRFMLVATLLGMALLAAFYLRRRTMSRGAYITWGLLALLLPLIGPFLVILNHPGRLKEEYRQPPGRHLTPASRLAATGRRLHTWLVRLRL